MRFGPTGVAAQVGASKNGALADRSCEAHLSWGKQSLAVAVRAAQSDLDAFAVDVGLGSPVATFQVKDHIENCCSEYRLYSLTRPPRLLRTITGGSYFAAADTDLDGRVEIWSDDAAAIDGFEDLSPGEILPPPLILRLQRGRLQDVSAEFREYFDKQIEHLRGQLTQEQLTAFKKSDGRLLSATLGDAERMHSLRATKAEILEIVLLYVYSGRNADAWHSLADMWPASDVQRIRTEIMKLYDSGIRRQCETGIRENPARKKNRAAVLDLIGDETGQNKGIVQPQAILLEHPAPINSGDPGEIEINLLIDAAGKVRTANAHGKSNSGQELVEATKQWKFVPALQNGRAVACWQRILVSSKE